jgi:sulfotransferase
MPRSGSELFQALVHQNPLIYGSPTSPLLEYQFAARSNYNLPEVKSQNHLLMFNAFLNMCRGMAESYYEALTDRPYIVDKNRGWAHYYEWVDQWNPNPKIICLVRDLRAVFGSMEKIYRKNRHSPECPDDTNLINNMTTLQRIAYWNSTQPIGLSLQKTLDLIYRGVDKNILFIRYEDLCRSPQQTMNKFYDYVELDRFKHDFDNIEKKVYEDSSYFGIFGDHSVSPKLNIENIDSWKLVIDSKMSEIIIENNKWFFEYFNYKDI